MIYIYTDIDIIYNYKCLALTAYKKNSLFQNSQNVCTLWVAGNSIDFNGVTFPNPSS